MEPAPVIVLLVVELKHGIVYDIEALLLAVSASDAPSLLPPLVSFKGDGISLDNFSVGVVSPERFTFLADKVLDSDFALHARIASGVGEVPIGPPDVAIGFEETLDPRVLVVDEALAVTLVALATRFVSIRAVDVVVFVVELELIHLVLVRIPCVLGPVGHFVDVLPCCVARMLAASVIEASGVAMGPLDVTVGL